MKKTLTTLLAALAITLSAAAQEENKPKRPQRNFNPGEMAKHQTEAMAKKYELNEEQAAKLLELNKEFGQKIRPQGRGQRPGGKRPEGRGPRPDKGDRIAADSLKARDGKHAGDFRKGEGRAMRQLPAASREEIEKQQAEYEGRLKEILGDEKFETYLKDKAERQQRRKK